MKISALPIRTHRRSFRRSIHFGLLSVLVVLPVQAALAQAQASERRDGSWQSKAVQVGASAAAARMSFVAAGD